MPRWQTPLRRLTVAAGEATDETDADAEVAEETEEFDEPVSTNRGFPMRMMIFVRPK